MDTLAGYKIPKGWKVILWVRYLHTNPENFDDPMCFNPDRWNVSEVGTHLAKRSILYQHPHPKKKKKTNTPTTKKKRKKKKEIFG